jgi:CHRD domain
MLKLFGRGWLKAVRRDTRPKEEKMNAIFRRAPVAFAFLLAVIGATAALAAPVTFKVPLNGAQCVPPVKTTGSGMAELTYDPATRVLSWIISYSGLSSPTTMAHFHGPAKQGQNAPHLIWLSAEGSAPPNPMTGTATLTPAQAQQFSAGEWYVNVHTKAHPAGEIRGQVIPPKS